MPAAPETVALYITDLAAGRGLKASTIRRRLAAISQLHKEAGHPSPAAHEHVKDVLKGIARRHGSLQEGADPILIGTVRRMLGPMEREEGPAAKRDRALLLLGLAGGLRRSELSALLVEDLSFVEEGVPYGFHPETCPVRNLKAWLAILGREQGPLFCQVDRHGNLKGGGLTAGHHPHDPQALRVRGARRQALLGPFLEGGTGDGGVGRRRSRQEDHGPDRTPLAAHVAPLRA